MPVSGKCKSLDNVTFAPARSSDTGGALCRPLSAPAQMSQHRWGVSDPASASHSRPRVRLAGSLTPHRLVSEMCWGARVWRQK
jgi:hypothetical protein